MENVDILDALQPSRRAGSASLETLVETPAAGPVALAHQVSFRGPTPEARHAYDQYLGRFRERGASVQASSVTEAAGAPFAARAVLALPGDATAVLTIAPPANAYYADVLTNVATLAVVDPGGLSHDRLGRLMKELDLLPLTEWELSEIRRQFPLTQEFVSRCDPSSLAGHALYMAIHHMTDFVGMMDALVALGVDLEHVTVLDKGYPYTQRHRVDGYLRDTLGLRIFTYPERAESIGDHIEMAKAAGLPTMVFDDGGHVVPIVLAEYADSSVEFKGLVEQTMSGIWKLEGLDVPMPIFTVAESNLKATIESYGVAEASVRSILNLLPHEKIEGQAALVVGYGRIGRQVAGILRARRMRVAVHDRETVQLVAAHEEGFATSRSLSRLIEEHEPLLLVGSAGRNSLNAEHVASFRKSCYLASVTSRTFEFNQDDLRRCAEDVKDYGRLGHGYLLPNGVELCLLGHGMPVNFYHAESLPNRYIDLVISALLLGGVTLAKPDQGGFRPGHNVELTNKVLNTSEILEIYYDWYGERAARRELLSPRPNVTAPFDSPPWTFDNHTRPDGTA
jgi:adenosylhomocysteinase